MCAKDAPKSRLCAVKKARFCPAALLLPLAVFACSTPPPASITPLTSTPPAAAPPLAVVSSARIVLRAEETTAFLETPFTGTLPEPLFRFEEPPVLAEREEEAAPPAPEEAIAAAPQPAPAVPPPVVVPPPPAPIAAPPPATPPPAPIATPAPPPVPPQPPANVRSAAPVPAQETPARPTPPRPALPAARLPPSETAPQTTAPSRSARARVGQLVEVPFRGAGWVYTGEAALKRGLDFDSRKLEAEGQTFVFRPKEAGNYTLLFSKHDFYHDYQIDDAVAVAVAPQEAPDGAQESRVRANPRWPPADWTPERRAASGAPPAAAPPDERAERAASQEAPYTAAEEDDAESAAAAPPPPPPPLLEEEEEALLRQAEAAYQAGNAALALESVEKIRQRNPALNDKALYLSGKAYEAPGAGRSIKNSIAAYRELTRNFPQSPYYREAAGRIAYLNKFYFNIK